MKSAKYLKKQSIKAASLSFKVGVLNKGTAEKFIKAFKKLPSGEAIPLLSFYLRAVKNQLSKTTMTITSASKLSSSQTNEIAKELKKDFKILETQEEIAPSILGGIQVKIGDIVFDGSLRQRLNQLKEAMVS